MNTSLLAGAEVRFLEAFDQDAIIIELPKSSMLMGVPKFYTRLLGDSRIAKDLCAGFRLFISGSAPLLTETHADIKIRTGHRILERYGMTKTNMNTSNPYLGDCIAGTVGYALPGTRVKITDSNTGLTLPAGEIGIIEERGDNGYCRIHLFVQNADNCRAEPLPMMPLYPQISTFYQARRSSYKIR